MKTNTLRNTIAGFVALAVIAVGSNALAGPGKGPRNDDRGYGYHDGRGGCGFRNPNLTPEQREQLQNERKAFFEATAGARQDLYAKRLALRAEVAKRNPDSNRASALQVEVSDLRAKLDQQRLDHILAMRKIDPEAGRGFFGDGPGMDRHHGYGRHNGPGRGMGDGPGYGPGYCRE